MTNQYGAIVTIESTDLSPTIKRILCSSVVIAGKRNIDAKPNANLDGPIEVQTLAFENLGISLQGVRFLPSTTGNLDTTTSPRSTISTFTYDDMLTLFKQKYNGSNAAKLKVVYGNTTLGQATLVGLEGSSPIPVILKDFSFPIDVRDSRDGYMPMATLNFQETK